MIFLDGDWKNIEGRMNAWLADETWKLEAFRANDAGTGPDLYVVTYSQAFGCDPTLVTKKQRQWGKVIFLACFAPDTQVLTDCGYVAIKEVTSKHKLWDGVEWVTGQGAVYRGQRGLVDLDGVGVTPDHQVWAGRSWQEARMGASSPAILRQWLAIGSGELTVIQSNQQKPLVQCSCGAPPHYVLASNLRSGASTRCNKCAKKASSRYRKNYYGYADIIPDEDLRRRLLNRFSSACSRCHNPKNSQFHAYGARGISVHQAWRFDRRAFLVYVLALPGVFDSSLDMDRIDNDKGYEPGNIQFIPHEANVAKKPSYGHRGLQKLKDRIADL